MGDKPAKAEGSEGQVDTCRSVSTKHMHVYMRVACDNVILCRDLLGPLALLDLVVSLMPTSLKEECIQTVRSFGPAW